MIKLLPVILILGLMIAGIVKVHEVRTEEAYEAEAEELYTRAYRAELNYTYLGR